MKAKRNYWLKLPKDFFQSKEIKKLQKRAGGDTYVKIYLKMLLLSLTNEGKIYFEQTEESLAEQLSIEIDENVNDIESLLMYLNHNKLITSKETGVFMEQIPEMIGSETVDAERKRRERNAYKTIKLGQCPEIKGQSPDKIGYCLDVSKNVPNIDIEKEIDIEIEKEREKEIDKEIEKEIDKEIEREQTNESIKNYINLVSESTEVNLFQVQQAISLSTLRNYDINMLILKIKESDFLLGKLDTKPKIRNFTQEKMLNLIMADSYKNKIKKTNTVVKDFSESSYKADDESENFLNNILEGIK